MKLKLGQLKLKILKLKKGIKKKDFIKIVRNILSIKREKLMTKYKYNKSK